MNCCCCCRHLARHTKSSVVEVVVVVVVGYEEDSCCCCRCWQEVVVVVVVQSRWQLSGSSCQGKALVPDNLGAQMNNEAGEEDRPSSRLVVQQEENVQHRRMKKKKKKIALQGGSARPRCSTMKMKTTKTPPPLLPLRLRRSTPSLSILENASRPGQGWAERMYLASVAKVLHCGW